MPSAGSRDAPSIRVVVTVRKGPLPRPGPRERPWTWEDVLAKPPPSKSVGAGTFAVRHGLEDGEEDLEARVGLATVVRGARGADGSVRVTVEELLAVEPRVLSRVLVVEREVTRRVAATSRRGLARVQAGSDALSQRMGRSGVVLERSTSYTVRGLRWMGRTLREGADALVEAPDRIAVGARSADAQLARRGGRRVFLRGLADPHSLSREGKAAALFLVGFGVAGTLLAVTLGVALASPEDAVAWRAVLGFFGLCLGSTLLLPFFPEAALPELAALVGASEAVATGVLGMTVGAWLVLFLGDEAHAALRRSVRPGSPLARYLDKAEAFAKRRGFWVAFLVLAIPFGPDTPVFYLLATVRTPARQYLAGVLLGITVRFSLVLVVPFLVGAVVDAVRL